MSNHLYGTKDYRRFLREELKRQGKTSAELGEAIDRSKAYVSLVLSGSRKLDPEVVGNAAKLLGLDEHEEAYLGALVDLESPSERARRAAMTVVQARQRHHEVSDEFSEDAAAVFELWYVPAVFELVGCEGFRADPAWIAQTMYPPISETQAEEALAILQRLGRLEDDGEGGLQQRVVELWSPADLPPGVATRVGLGSHRTMMALAADSLREFKYNERYVAGITTAMTEAQYEWAMGRIKEVMLELVAMPDAPEGESPNRVFHLSAQLFPLSLYTDTEYEPTDEEDEKQ